MIPDRETTTSNGYRTRALAIMLVLFMVVMVVTPMVTLAAGVEEPVGQLAPVIGNIEPEDIVPDEVPEAIVPEVDTELEGPVPEEEELIGTIEEVEDFGSRDPTGLFNMNNNNWAQPEQPVEEEESQPVKIDEDFNTLNRPSCSLVRERGHVNPKPLANPPGPYPDAWTGVTPLPNSLVRYAHAQDPANPDSFYVFTGVSHGSIVDRSWRYDVPTDTWNPLAPIPTDHEGPTGACDGTNVYVMGGSNDMDQLQIYNIAGDSWSTGANLPRNSIMAAAGAWGGQVFLISGENDFSPGGLVGDVNIYDVGTDTWVGTGTAAPTPTGFAGYYQVGSYVYIVGGWDGGSPGANVAATQRYDMATDTWTVGPAFTPAKSDFALAHSASDNKLYAIGGDADGGGFWEHTDTVWSLDLSAWPAGAWVDTADPIPLVLSANNAGFYTDIGFDNGVWTVGGITTGWTFVGDTYYKITAPPPPWRCDLTPPTHMSYGYPGTDVTYAYTVTNTGANADAYDLSASGNSWPVTFWETGGIVPVTMINEGFEGAFPPAGWNVVNYGGDDVWQRNDVWGRPNYAGGSGFCADADSDAIGIGTTMDTGMRTPSLNLNGYSSATLDFIMSYNDLMAGGEWAEVRVSTNGGGSWTTIDFWDWDVDPLGPGQSQSYDISAYCGNPNVIIEFYYAQATWDWWFEVDDVLVVGTPSAVSITSTPVVPPGGTFDFLARHHIPPTANPGDLDTAYIRTTSQGDGSVWGDAQLTTQVPYDQIFDGFETGGLPGGEIVVINPGGPPPTNWEIGVPNPGYGPASPYHGSYCAGTNLNDWYYENTDIMLVSPYVDIGPTHYMEFYNWYSTDPGGDGGGWVEVSWNNCPWTQIAPTGGYPMAGFMGGYSTSGYGGTSGGWVYEYYDLSAYIGTALRARFHFASGSIGWNPGWYVDDVYIGPPPPHDVELTPDWQSHYGYPGTNVNYFMTVENTGTSPDAYDLSATGNSWPVKFYEGGPALGGEDFNAAFPPPGWTTTGVCVASQSGAPWATHYWAQYDDSYYPLTTSPPTCAGIWWSDGNGGDTVQDEWLIYQTDLSYYMDLQMEFWTIYNWNSAPYGWPNYRNAVEVSTDGGATWTQVAELAQDPAYQLGGAGFGGWEWNWNEVPISLDLTPFCGNSNVQIAWHYYCDPPGTGFAIWMVDDVSFTGTQMADQITQTPTIPPGGTFDFIAQHQVPTGATPGASDTPVIWATSQGDPTAADDGSFKTTVPVSTPMYWDFDSYEPGWDESNSGGTVWELGNPAGGVGPGAAASPPNCWGTNLMTNYQLPSEAFLDSPPIVLGPGDQYYRFDHWYQIDGMYYSADEEDGGWVEISNDGGATWTQIYPTYGYNDMTGDTPPGYGGWVECWAGWSNGWQTAEFDVSAYAGQTVTFRHRFFTEQWWESADYAGWYVDNVYAGPDPYSVELIPDYQIGDGISGRTLDFTHTVINNGLYADAYDLSATSTWPITFHEGGVEIFNTPTVPPGGTWDFTTRVHLPPGLTPGSFDSATILATSQADPLYTWDDAIIDVNGDPAYWFDATPPTQTRFGWTGDYVDHIITIENQGALRDAYTPMFGDFLWRVEFFEIGESDPTWWVGPVEPGETHDFYARVRVPRVDFGDFDIVDITITSVGDPGQQTTVEIITRTTLPTPYYNTFDTGVFGQGVTDSDWTSLYPDRAGVNDMTCQSSPYSMYSRWGYNEITSCLMHTGLYDPCVVSFWLRRGAAGFSEDPDSGEDLTVEYYSKRYQWEVLERFLGDGTPGQVYTPTIILPENARHPRFQLRFVQHDGSGDDYDYWHIDNVYVGPPGPFDLQPTHSVAGGGPGSYAVHPMTIVNDGYHHDWYQMSYQSNWPMQAWTARYTDNFNDGNYNGWVVVDEGTNSPPSNWYVDGNGYVRQTSNIHTWDSPYWSGTYLYWDNPEAYSWTDYIYRTQLMPVDNDGNGVMFRYTDQNNYYRFRWSWQYDMCEEVPGTQKRVLDVCENGVWRQLAWDDVLPPYGLGHWYNFQVTCLGDNIRTYVNGELVFDVTDSTHNQGTVALYCWGQSNQWFDDVYVLTGATDLVGPVPPLGGTYNFYVTSHIPDTAQIGDMDSAQMYADSIYNPGHPDMSTLDTHVYPVHNLNRDTWHPTINDGIDNSYDDDRLFVYSGTYQEELVIDKPVWLMGEDPETTILDGTYAEPGIYLVSTHTADAGWDWGWENGRWIDNSLDWLWPNYAHSGPILLVWDNPAWGDSWRQALAARSIPYTQIPGSAITPGDLDASTYTMIIMAEYMDNPGVANMEGLAGTLQSYVEDGGVLVDMIATNFNTRWAGGTPGPFGVETTGTLWYDSYMVDPSHPMLAGMTPPTTSGNYDCHGEIPIPPAGSDVLMTAGVAPGGVPVATILETGSGGDVYRDTVVRITGEDVGLTGFTIQNGETGVFLDGALGCWVQDNIITTQNGILCDRAGYILIDENIIQSADTYNSGSLETMFAQNNGYDGNMFDVTAHKELTITGFDVNMEPGLDHVEVYYKQGSHVGFETDPTAWTLLDATRVASNGVDVPTYVPCGGLTIPQGQTYGLYVTTQGTVGIDYTNGVNSYSNSDLTFDSGVGKEYPFGSTFFPRTWNGRIYYNLGDSAGGTGINIIGRSNSNSFSDDFSTDTGSWTYVNSGQRTNEYIQLTPNTGGQVGQAWYTTAIHDEFVADFDYYIGGGSGADGLVFMFYKDSVYTPITGGDLGFSDGAPVPGYGIEFDTYYNAGFGDINNRHVGLVQDMVDNHLVQYNEPRVRDGQWHHARVIVQGPSVVAFIDDMTSPALSYYGTIDTTFGGMGFSAATGGLTDYHRVDNFRVSWGASPENNYIWENTIQDYTYGVGNEWADDNEIYYNNFIDNTRQAYDGGVCIWDQGYPSGGNYWNDHTGPDSFQGPAQATPGSDGIVDTPYILDGDSLDNYPLADPYDPMGSPPGGAPNEEADDPIPNDNPAPEPLNMEESEEVIEEPAEVEEQEIELEEEAISEEVIAEEPVAEEQVEEIEAEPVVVQPIADSKGFTLSWLLFPAFFIVVLVPAAYRHKRKHK